MCTNLNQVLDWRSSVLMNVLIPQMDFQALELIIMTLKNSLHRKCLFAYSCKLMQVENGRKQASNNIPESVLWRVRELAIMHPYPRESRSKVLCTAPTVSSFPATTDNTLVSLSTAISEFNRVK